MVCALLALPARSQSPAAPPTNAFAQENYQKFEYQIPMRDGGQPNHNAEEYDEAKHGVAGSFFFPEN